MNETSKSIMRRMHDPASVRYFVGKGIDVGAGSDPLAKYMAQFPRVTQIKSWDKADGDAATLPGVEPESFDFLYSSHCLEHLPNPEAVLAWWLRAVKPGGHLIIMVPDEDLYERGDWPSKRNPEHKNSYTVYKPHGASWCRDSVNVLDLVRSVGATAECLSVRRLWESYSPDSGDWDQTMGPVAECAIEFVLRKRP